MSQRFDPRDRESVVRDLGNSDEEVRRLAVERVALLPSEEALPLLAERLGDPSWRVRNAAVERIAVLPETELLIPPLLAALGDAENPGRRNSAVAALIEAGPRVVPALLGAIVDPDADVRKFAVDALAGIGDPSASEGLVQALEDSDANVRAAAADALGASGCVRAAQPLLARALDPAEDATVRFSALRALLALQHPVRSGELSGVLDDPLLGAAGLELLGRCDDDPDALRVLLKGLQAGARRSREAAMRGLLRLLARCDGSEAEAVVRAVRAAAEADFLLVADSIERLEDADVPTRLVLVQFLGLLRSPATVPPLLRQAREKALAEVVFDTLAELGDAAELGLDTAWSTLDAVAKRDACEVLGRTAGERGVQRLLSALEDDDPEVRVAAAASIGRRRASAALPVLIRHLEAVASRVGAGHEEAGVLARAIASVAEPRAGAEDVNREAVGLLHGVLDGAGDELRFAVAGILGCIGRPEDTELVTLLLKDPSAGVRRAAIDALARLEPGTAAESLRLAVADESPRVRVAAACALGASESDAVIEDLARLAEDDDRWVRAAAARALGIHFARATADEPRRLALEVLERALEDDALVALGAVEALAGVGGPPALRVAELLGRPEPELVQEAIACLGHHADSDALAALLPLVAHPEWSVRAAAIDVLAARGVKRAVPTMLRRLESEEDEHVRQVLLRALERLEAE